MTHELTREQTRHLLGKVCELRHRRMHKLLDDLGLYSGQPSMLSALWERDGAAQSELSDLLGKSPATVTKMVKRMEKAGFVERRPDPSDERVSHVYLTDSGRSIKAALEEVWRTFEEQALAGFDEAELGTLRDCLARVCHNIKDEFCRKHAK
jgi:DNA-binding MarR family transcriptional regulator